MRSHEVAVFLWEHGVNLEAKGEGFVVLYGSTTKSDYTYKVGT